MGAPNFLTDSWTDLEKFFGLNGQTTANTVGLTPTQAHIASGAATVTNLGLLTSVFGGINSAIGSYFQAQSQQNQAKAQASSLNFQADMDALNARSAELSAQSITESGKTQVAQYTIRAGQEEASSQVATAARGVDLSSGSAVISRASDQLVKDIDTLTISANATRAAWAQRTQAVNYQNESDLARVSAQNVRASGNTISPGFAATTSLLGSATQVASQWDWRRRLQTATAGAQ